MPIIFVGERKYTMKKTLLLSVLICLATLAVRAQATLPSISVRNLNGKIIVSWKNAYTVPVANITIQRSYDSLKNYTTIGSVLNPQNTENGYADVNPPYNKMYYRVFVAFEGGSYIITQPARPVKDATADTATVLQPWQVNPFADSTIQVPSNTINYPSKRIYTTKENSIIIHLPDASVKKYTAKFFDENETQVFELTNLKEEFLIIEKVNFMHSGWYRFELYDAGVLVEKNKIFVPRDGKNSANDLRRNLNR